MVKINTTQLNLLNLVYDIGKAEPVSMKLLIKEAKNILDLNSSYAYNQLTGLSQKGLLQKIGPRSDYKVVLTKEGLQRRGDFKLPSEGRNLDKRGVCKCGHKGMLYYFRGQYVCSNCFNSGEGLKLEQFIYRAYDRFLD